jgi:4-hydroxybenzoate polyprenyltransferase
MYAFVYLSVYASELSLQTAVLRLAWFTLTIIATAAFGYFLNDWTDIEQDAKAGKSNAVSKLSQSQRIAVAFALLLCSWAPWIVLPRNAVNMTFMVLQYVAFTCYSCRPIRLKERNQWGLICDMLYGHLIPIVVTVTTFNDETSYLRSLPFFSLLIPWLLCKGLRNILLHQINDRAKDRSAQVQTLVQRFGPLRIIGAINYVILPLEITVLSGLLGLLAVFGVALYPAFPLFLLFTGLKFSAWKLPFLPGHNSRLKFLYFMNDFYEDWLPLAALIVLVISRPSAILVMGAHLCMFPWPIFNIGRDLVVIRRNLFAR